MTRLSNERSTWVCVWSISCGNIALCLPQNVAGYTIAFSYTETVSDQFEAARNNTGLWTCAAARRLRRKCRTFDPNPHTRPARARHGADRKLDPGAAAGRAATGQHRL